MLIFIPENHSFYLSRGFPTIFGWSKNSLISLCKDPNKFLGVIKKSDATGGNIQILYFTNKKKKVFFFIEVKVIEAANGRTEDRYSVRN